MTARNGNAVVRLREKWIQSAQRRGVSRDEMNAQLERARYAMAMGNMRNVCVRGDVARDAAALLAQEPGVVMPLEPRHPLVESTPEMEAAIERLRNMASCVWSAYNTLRSETSRCQLEQEPPAPEEKPPGRLERAFEWILWNVFGY